MQASCSEFVPFQGDALSTGLVYDHTLHDCVIISEASVVSAWHSDVSADSKLLFNPGLNLPRKLLLLSSDFR